MSGKTPAPETIRELPALLADFVRPALRIVRQKEPSSSHLGGVPNLPEDFPWPTADGAPLSLLASLDLESVHHGAALDWLPPVGRLLFFYDAQHQPWGFDHREKEQWRVLFLPCLAQGAVDLHPSTIKPFPRQEISFQAMVSYPSAGRSEVASLAMTQAEAAALGELIDVGFAHTPKHQVGGWPVPVQEHGMEIECHLGTQGVYCGKKDYRDAAHPAAMQAQLAQAGWRLLLQLDSDHKSKFKWSNGGSLYFWVRAAEAARGDFSSAWVVLQCL